MPRVIAALLVAVLAGLAALPSVASADEGFVIKSFGTSYAVREDGSIDVIEDLLVEFTAQKHGIFRDIPVLFAYDAKHDREYKVDVRSVTDGQRAWRYEVSREGAILRIKIGDPDRFVTGTQRYVITYRLGGALNTFRDHEELYWNITGVWGVPIERASAAVTAPSITAVECFQGFEGSRERCQTGISPSRADFVTGRALSPGEQLTIVVGLAKGSVAEPQPILRERKTPGEVIRDFLGLKPLPIAAAAAVGALAFGVVIRLWWLQGRDRWYGDVQYLSGATAEERKPLGARETVVVEYAPPEVGKPPRPLRPAEVGLLMDEAADTLDVSATIVDLAVRGYLRITEEGERKYSLTRIKEPDGDLLPYEAALHRALFEGTQGTVRLDDLKDIFYDDLARVKEMLYTQAVKQDRMFPVSPQTVRGLYAVASVLVMMVGGAAIFVLGAVSAGIVGVPIALAGLALLAASPSMPRRTAAGRELYRRARGFREYMVTAETDRARFAEEVGLFEKYLPYAVVFKVTEKWAKAFEGLGAERATMSWYTGTRPFVISDFARDIGSFSTSIASVMASTPSSSGGSGFSGGGGAGGGGGGGGGGSW